jgi:Putative transposase of IS4/5 family (DUF4096)
MELSDVQWDLLKPLVEPKTPRKRRGRPWRDTRQVVEGVLWILRTGAQWAELPKDKFPPYQTCHRRFQRWVREGKMADGLDSAQLRCGAGLSSRPFSQFTPIVVATISSMRVRPSAGRTNLSEEGFGFAICIYLSRTGFARQYTSSECSRT